MPATAAVQSAACLGIFIFKTDKRILFKIYLILFKAMHTTSTVHVSPPGILARELPWCLDEGPRPMPSTAFPPCRDLVQRGYLVHVSDVDIAFPPKAFWPSMLRFLEPAGADVAMERDYFGPINCGSMVRSAGWGACRGVGIRAPRAPGGGPGGGAALPCQGRGAAVGAV